MTRDRRNPLAGYSTSARIDEGRALHKPDCRTRGFAFSCQEASVLIQYTATTRSLLVMGYSKVEAEAREGLE